VWNLVTANTKAKILPSVGPSLASTAEQLLEAQLIMWHLLSDFRYSRIAPRAQCEKSVCTTKGRSGSGMARMGSDIKLRRNVSKAV